jgi:nickel-dependent lactate racemase
MQLGNGVAVLALPDAQLLSVHRQAPVPAITDVSCTVRNALENPIGFPALRRALTPDDHVAIVVDEQLADLPRFLIPMLEHLAEANIAAEAVTLLCTDPDGPRDWAEQVRGAFPSVKVEGHDPQNRKRLSYLATTKQGRRVYLNRTAVDADQLVVLSRRFYDPLFGIGGAEGTVYPALGDAQAQHEILAKLSMAAPGQTAWPARKEAAEITWLLGAPFFVQVIEGPENDVAHVLGGLSETSAEGQHRLDACWRVEVDQVAEVVIAEIRSESARNNFAAWARALACASRVVAPEGRIVLVSDGAPELGPGAKTLRQADTAAIALRLLDQQQPADQIAAFQWASAVQRAKTYVLSRLAGDVIEDLFAVPLDNSEQIERIVGSARCLYLSDADKTLAVNK